ncbi:hypothetical protein [Sphingosinicella soli]|uniref:Phage tail tape-measure protein n=1 Tax=Sphingosinicella soli TaxID=333708 RepID=A0A7W7B0C8_9SPHN|nr:hypothetical protein [Sphingosinicella soli]MBB4631529.1 phage tail tape-measure protein [Sphingosinicella soli]
MRKSMIVLASGALLALGACTGSRTVDSGLIGAGVGAAAGSVVPGVSTTEGAIAGGAAGAIYGAVTDGKAKRGSKEYCRDRYPRNSRDYDLCRRDR